MRHGCLAKKMSYVGKLSQEPHSEGKVFLDEIKHAITRAKIRVAMWSRSEEEH